MSNLFQSPFQNWLSQNLNHICIYLKHFIRYDFARFQLLVFAVGPLIWRLRFFQCPVKPESDLWRCLEFGIYKPKFFLFLDCASFSKSVKQGNKGTVNGHAECFYLSDHERACTATNQCNQRMSVSAWNKTIHLYELVIIKPVDQVLPWFRFSLWKQ